MGLTYASVGHGGNFTGLPMTGARALDGSESRFGGVHMACQTNGEAALNIELDRCIARRFLGRKPRFSHATGRTKFASFSKIWTEEKEEDRDAKRRLGESQPPA
jgi:hypothetical protein